MAQVVTIAANDRISIILKEKRGVKGQDLNAWLSKIRPLNPHISDPDRVFPGEKVLIPDALNENVPRQQIWNNAFSHVPPQLARSYHGHSDLFITSGAETITSLLPIPSAHDTTAVANHARRPGPCQPRIAQYNVSR